MQEAQGTAHCYSCNKLRVHGAKVGQERHRERSSVNAWIVGPGKALEAERKESLKITGKSKPALGNEVCWWKSISAGDPEKNHKKVFRLQFLSLEGYKGKELRHMCSRHGVIGAWPKIKIKEVLWDSVKNVAFVLIHGEAGFGQRTGLRLWKDGISVILTSGDDLLSSRKPTDKVVMNKRIISPSNKIGVWDWRTTLSAKGFSPLA